MLATINDEEPPIQKSGHRGKFNLKSVPTAARAVFSIPFSKHVIYWLPLVLVVSVLASNFNQGRSYASSLDSFVTLVPKSKVEAMKAIDRFTPFVEESKDAEPVVAADTTPTELVLNKPSLTQVTPRPDEQPKERTSTITHTVAAGETLSQIAAAYGLKVGSIQVDNSGLTSVDSLKVGEDLRIPPKDYDQTYIDQQLKKKQPVTVALANTSRTVAVRGTSTARYSNSGQPNFRRPAVALGRNGYHTWAIDVPPDQGSGVYASAAGIVIEVGTGWDGGYGNKIVVDHGSGWQTLYAHLSQFLVSAGQTVSAGQQIGIMGATGRVIPKGAVHLHFEVRQNGVRLNPLNFIE